jgi:hypothetical protein
MSPRQNGGTNSTTKECGPLSPTGPQVSNQAATNNDQIPLQVCRVYPFFVIKATHFLTKLRALQQNVLYPYRSALTTTATKTTRRPLPVFHPPSAMQCQIQLPRRPF